MLEKDLAALNNRLFDNIDIVKLQTLVENQPDENIDDTQVWTRWIINPGISTSRALGKNPIVTQYGTATLQIFVPKGLYTGPGVDIREQFYSLFRSWSSADKKLAVGGLKSTQSTYTRGTTEFYLINAMFNWRSNRRSSDI